MAGHVDTDEHVKHGLCRFCLNLMSTQGRRQCRRKKLEDRFCVTKKDGIGGGGRVSARDTVHMAAALAGCRKALVGTGMSISLLLTRR